MWASIATAVESSGSSPDPANTKSTPSRSSFFIDRNNNLEKHKEELIKFL
jgi:hypothetical protein